MRRIGGPPPGGRLAVLDGLRLLAALMVVAFHHTFLSPAWGVNGYHVFVRLARVTAYGRYGVELFFLISGFVICMSAWGRSLGQFVTSRVTRLYPAYWFAVLATTAALRIYGHGTEWWNTRVPLRDLLVNLTMLQEPAGVAFVDPVYWTLWNELHFYLLFAIVVWRRLTYRRVVVFCVLWLTATVLFPSAAQPSQLPPLSLVDVVVDPNHAPFFIAGTVLYLMYRFRPTALLWGILGVCYALAVSQAGRIADQSRLEPGQLPHSVAYVVMTAVFAVMIAVALGWLNWVRGAWLTTAGALTYPLYLFHEKIGWLVILVLHDKVPKWPLLIGLVTALLVVAWLVHRLVERPLSRRLKRALTDAIAETSADRHPQRTG